MKTLENIKLTEKEQSSIKQAVKSLKSELPVSKIILFGSKARGDSEKYSDIDLLIITNCPVTSNMREVVSSKLAEINIENDVMISSLVVYQKEWLEGLIHYMPIYNEVQRDGCLI
jgi:predicted nucleotidyltransferase